MNASAIGEEYEVIRSLGQGGTAEVFLVKDRNRKVFSALKMPLSGSVGDLATFRALINREYEIIGGQRFPGLVRLRKLNDSPTLPYLEMEFCSGKSLDTIGRIDDRQILLRLLSSLSITLYYLHLAGVVHGDLKPHNVFVMSNSLSAGPGVTFISKISDFSLAIKNGEDVGKRLGIGTVGYMAPETIRSGALDHRSDIFALGVVAYLLATGRHPFMAEDGDPVQTNAAIQESEPLHPSAVRADIPENLSEIIMQMLSKIPEKRPQDGFDLCCRLKAAGSDYPFERIIRPKYLMQAFSNLDNQSFLNKEFIRFSAGIKNRLFDYAGNRRNTLRSLLEVNFSSGEFQWKERALVSVSDAPEKIIFAAKLRRALENEVRRLTFRQKRMAIKIALAGDMERAKILGIEPKAAEGEIYSRPILYCLRKNLSDATVRRQSTVLAQRAIEQYKSVELGAELFLQAGNFKNAYAAVMEAADLKISRNENGEAVALLSALEALASNGDDETGLPALLVKKADAQKGMGELLEAEDCYKRIIARYQNKLPDKLLAETYKDLGDLYRMKQDFESGIEALRIAEQIYSALEDHLELSHSINNIGNIYCINNQFEEAFRYFRRALHIQKRLGAMKDAASVLNNISYIYYTRGRLPRMTKILSLVLELNREAGNLAEIARVHNNLGFAYNEIGDISKAIDNLHESLQINEKIGNKKELLFNYENLVQAMIRGGQLREALRYLSKGISLSDQLDDRPHTGMFAGFTSQIQKRMGLYGEALKNGQQAVEIAVLLDDKPAQELWLTNLAEIYLRVNDGKKALDIILEAERIAAEIGDKRSIIFILALKGTLLENMEFLEAAETKAIEVKVGRDLTLVRLRKASLLASSGMPIEAIAELRRMNFSTIPQSNDIESAGYFYLWGICLAATNRNKEAVEYLFLGLKTAQSMGLLPEIADCAVALARIKLNSGAHEEAFHHFRKALSCLKKMTENISDDSQKEKFLEKGQLSYLAEEVSRLSGSLGKKTGASR